MFCKPKLAQLGLSLNFNFSIGLPSSLQTICKLEECGTFFKFNLQTLSYSYFRGCIRRMRLNLGCWGLSVAFPSPRSKHLVLLLLLASRPHPCSVSGERFRWTFLEIAASVDFPWMRRPKYWKWLNKSQLIFSLLPQVVLGDQLLHPGCRGGRGAAHRGRRRRRTSCDEVEERSGK